VEQSERAAAGARTPHELLNVAREFIATFTPAEIASVPEACRPARIKGTDDLHHWHQRLAEAFCEGAPRAAQSPAHTRLLSFFTAACDRARELEAGDAANDVSASCSFRR